MLTAVTPNALVPQHHPIRRIKAIVDQALAQLSPTPDRPQPHRKEGLPMRRV